MISKPNDNQEKTEGNVCEKGNKGPITIFQLYEIR